MIAAARLLSTSVASSASNIPTDVKFLFKKEEEDGSTTVKEVNAHKFILALVSDVFRAEFYGALPDENTIDIKDVNQESFGAMIDFIYNREGHLGTYDLDTLCALYCLGDRDKYNIDILVKESLTEIRCKEISTENILNVGLLAEQYSPREQLVDTLYDSAAQSLSEKFDGEFGSVIEFFNKLGAEAEAPASPSVTTLMKIVGKVKKPTVCENCKSSPCMDGIKLTLENFVPDADVMLEASVSLTGKAIRPTSNEISQFLFVKRGASQVEVKNYSLHYNEGQKKNVDLRTFKEDYVFVYNC